VGDLGRSAKRKMNIRASTVLWGLFLGGCGLLTLVFASSGLLSRLNPEIFETAYIHDDWPDGDHSDKDRWRGGQIYGLRADLIRRVAKPSGSGVDADTITYFMRVSMDDSEFNGLIDRLGSADDCQFQPPDRYIPSARQLQPEWFPSASSETYVGEARDGGWSVSIFRSQTDPYTYFVLR